MTRCNKRINEVYENNPLNLEDLTKQDSIILMNIHREYLKVGVLI